MIIQYMINYESYSKQGLCSHNFESQSTFETVFLYCTAYLLHYLTPHIQIT